MTPAPRPLVGPGVLAFVAFAMFAAPFIIAGWLAVYAHLLVRAVSLGWNLV